MASVYRNSSNGAVPLCHCGPSLWQQRQHHPSLTAIDVMPSLPLSLTLSTPTLVILSLLLLQLLLLLVLALLVSMMLIATGVDDGAGTGVDAATTRAGTAGVPQSRWHMPPWPSRYGKLRLMKMSTAASADLMATPSLGKVAYNVCYKCCHHQC